VEKECAKIDEDYKEKIVIDNKAHLSKIETSLDTAGNRKKKDYLVLFHFYLALLGLELRALHLLGRCCTT
jgi:hypothetical protein